MTRTNEVMASANLTWWQVLHFRFESARNNSKQLIKNDARKTLTRALRGGLYKAG